MTAKTRRKLKNSFLIFLAVYRVGIYPTIAFAMFHNRATIRMCNFMSGKCETVNNANATHIYHIHNTHTHNTIYTYSHTYYIYPAVYSTPFSFLSCTPADRTMGLFQNQLKFSSYMCTFHASFKWSLIIKIHALLWSKGRNVLD